MLEREDRNKYLIYALIILGFSLLSLYFIKNKGRIKWFFRRIKREYL